jgi:hypothetical protein
MYGITVGDFNFRVMSILNSYESSSLQFNSL